MQPYTIWTYCNFDSLEDNCSDVRIASTLFQDIAIQVIKSHDMAVIKFIDKCNGSKVKETLRNIHKLFNQSKQLKIIENQLSIIEC